MNVNKIKLFFVLMLFSLVASAQYVYVPIQFNRMYQFYGGCQLREISAPATPVSGFGHVYAKTDGRLYFKNDGGTEYLLTPGGGAGTVTSIATSSPITGGTITTTGTIGINDAAADGTTKGAASFSASDFNSSGGNISIDYANGQAATSGQDGFLQSADWTTFNNKTGLVATPLNLTGQTAAIAATTYYTTPAADGYYRISISGTITTTGTTPDIGIQCKWTNANDNVVKTWPSGNVNNMNRTNTNNTGTGTFSLTTTVFVKASTAIQYVVVMSGTATYDLTMTVEKLTF